MADEKKTNEELEENTDGEFEEYEPQIVELDGESFEVIDAVCYDGQNYVALVPYTEDDESEDDEVEFIILKEVEENGEYMLATVDDEDLYNEVGEAFIEHLGAVFGDGHEDGCGCEDCR
ncbi:MAG: DUF1292 domain-containing protein [Bacteroides sp.]|nr:DUF1292 domain-containing protein [Bacteroides sp.]